METTLISIFAFIVGYIAGRYVLINPQDKAVHSVKKFIAELHRPRIKLFHKKQPTTQLEDTLEELEKEHKE